LAQPSAQRDAGIDPEIPVVGCVTGVASAIVATQVILLPGGVMPAGLAYGALLASLGGEVEAVAKELELYAGPEPPSDYSLQDEIDGILRTADDAGFERFHLVGYSGGGASSLAFAAAHPERLSSLALLEPAWMGNDGLTPEEEAVSSKFDRIATLPPEQMMGAFVANQLAPGVEPPPPPPGPSPPWMATRPAGLRTFITTIRSSTLDLVRLRAFEQPVLFVLGAKSNPDYYGRMAQRASAIFPDFTLEVFDERHHFDPPHRIEPDRTAEILRSHWARSES
jgi:pimeloyl-ACP methyl ester carboxylesterase